MATPPAADALARVPSRGWVGAPTPIEPLPTAGTGLAWFGAKRDDQGLGLVGGVKVRKLDSLLAAEPWASAPGWVSIGAIGSGHLVALSAAARALGRTLGAGMFWEPPDATVVRNLAWTASGPGTLAYAGSRVELALRHPRWLLARRVGALAVVPPGGSVPAAIVGMVRAGLELAAQVRAGVLPAPDHVVLPLGTGGSAVGLAVGLALAGLETEVVGVCVVERILSTDQRIRGLVGATRAHLRGLGVDPGERPVRLVLERGFLGPGYGRPAPAALEACARLGPDLPLEPVYGGKAMAAILCRPARFAGKRVLFWQTACTRALAPEAGWRDRLPPRLARRLALLDAGAAAAPSRRAVLVGAGALALAAATLRVGLHPAPPSPGLSLSDAELDVLAAAAEAVLADPGDGLRPTPAVDPRQVATRVDRYVATLPTAARLEIHGLLALVEHATLLDGRVRRLTRLPVAARRAFLARLAGLGTLPGQAARGLRDLVYLGTYQDPATWPAIGYEGPHVDRPAPMGLTTTQLRASGPTAAALLAPADTLPRSRVP